MLRSFWSYVASTPQKSSQSQPNAETDSEDSPTPTIQRSEQQLDMPSSRRRSSTSSYDRSEGETTRSSSAKRKRSQKVKSSPVSIVEVPATAEKTNETESEDGAMGDISNAEAGVKRKRRKSDLELSGKKAKKPRRKSEDSEDSEYDRRRRQQREQSEDSEYDKRPRQRSEDSEHGKQITINGSKIDDDESEDEKRPVVPGVKWFGDVAAVFYEGAWVEADADSIRDQYKRNKAKAKLLKARSEPEKGPEKEREAIVEETDREDRGAQATEKQKKEQKKKKVNKQREPTPEPEEEEEEEEAPRAEPEPEEEPKQVEEVQEEQTTKKQKKEKGKKSRKNPEPEPESSPTVPATKARKRRNSTKEPAPESSRRRTYPRDGGDANPPPVIIPAATDGSHGNSKGVGPPPPPAVYDKGPYTPAEDALINSVVNRYCQVQIPPLNRAGFINILWNNERHKTDFWNILMTNLPLRSRYSLHSHVKRMYHNFEDRGKWTQEQDDELRDLVAQKGSKWSVIGNIIHRMPEDCRDRWKNYVVCGEKRRTHAWDDDETDEFLTILDDMLNTLVRFHEEDGTLVLEVPGGENEEERAERLEKEKGFHREEIDWAIVSERMGHRRSRIQCLCKAKSIWEKTPDGVEYGSVKKSKPGYKAENQSPKKTKSKSAKKEKKKRNDEEKEETEEIPSPTAREAGKMLPGDYLFIMQRISIQGYDCLASIDWNKLAQVDTVKHFTPEQFKAGFHNYMKDYNPQKKDLRSFVAEQLEEMAELPGMIRNKRYRPPVGASSPAVPATTEKKKANAQKKKESTKQVQQTITSDGDSPVRRVNTKEKPSHSPGNPFAKQPNGEKTAASPLTQSNKATPAKAAKKSPRKQYKSSEYISDSGDGAEDSNDKQVDSRNGDVSDAESEDLEDVSEADDEMGESVAFGNASKGRR